MCTNKQRGTCFFDGHPYRVHYYQQRKTLITSASHAQNPCSFRCRGLLWQFVSRRVRARVREAQAQAKGGLASTLRQEQARQRRRANKQAAVRLLDIDTVNL